MADATKNVVNQYSYNSPYIKTLTEEQIEALYPTGIPVPKDLLLHISNNNDIDYFVIGDGEKEFEELPKHSSKIFIGNNEYNYKKIQFNDNFTIENNQIGINAEKFPSKSYIDDLKTSINDHMASLLTLQKQLYIGNNKFNTSNWIQEINNSQSYNKENSFFLYNFLNCAYEGSYINNSPLRFYSFCPFNLEDTISIKFYNRINNQDEASIIIENLSYNNNTDSWEGTNTGGYTAKVYFSPKIEQENSVYNLKSFYPYIYIESKDGSNNLINRDSVIVYITGPASSSLLSNADIYWVTCENNVAKTLTYFGTLNMSNNLIIGTNNNSGQGIDTATLLKYLKYYLLGTWDSEDPTPSGEIKFDKNAAENISDTNLILKDMFLYLNYLLNTKISSSDVQNNYVKKPTTENKEGWTELNGTGISATDNKKIKYSFNVYDYKSQEVES